MGSFRVLYQQGASEPRAPRGAASPHTERLMVAARTLSPRGSPHSLTTFPPASHPSLSCPPLSPPSPCSLPPACPRSFCAEGVRGYFAGLSATLAQSPPSTAVYFLTYEYAKAAGLAATGGANADAVYFAAGAASELFASLVFVPLEVVKSRLQLGENPARATGGVLPATSNFPSIRAALAGIYAERGMAGLTAGWKAGFVQDVAYSATQFLVYENMRAWFEARSGKRATTEETLLCGCVAGGVGAAITNPLDVVTSRLMVQDGSAGYGGGTMGSVFRAAVAEGPGALWRGTVPRVAQIAPLSAIAFAVYEGALAWQRAHGGAFFGGGGPGGGDDRGRQMR
jgi:hypothetical protein